MREKLIEVVKEAGQLLKESYFSNKEVSFKAKKDLVTQYDVAIEGFLKERFLEEFPSFNIIAEESPNDDVEFNNSIIIDPIDGTTNFVNQVPHTCISVGICKNKVPVIGVVYNPILGELYEGELGYGAFLNKKKIEVSHEDTLEKSLISTGFPYTSGTNEKDLEDVLRKIKNILPKCQDIRRLGSAAVDLCYVAKGIYEGYYEMNLKAWDVCAGIVILNEAGGKVSSLDATEYKLFEDKYIVASNGLIHDEFINNLTKCCTNSPNFKNH